MRKFLKKLEVTNITNLTTYQINKLEVGDVVAKKTNGQYHHYIVSYKENNVGMCLTYTDASVVETVSYDYTEGNWVYNSTDTSSIEGGGGTTVVANPTLAGTEDPLTGLEVNGTKYAVPQGGGGIEFVEITGESGTLTSEQATALLNGAFLKITNENYIMSIIPVAYGSLSKNGDEVVTVDLYYNFRTFDNDVITEILICVTINLEPLEATYHMEFYTHNVTPIQPEEGE